MVKHSQFVRAWVVGTFCLWMMAGSAACGKSATPEPAYANICERLAERLPRVHLLHLEMGDLISSRAWTNMLASFDYERLYFLQSDVDQFRKRETTLDDDLKSGDMSFAIEMSDVFQVRLSNRVDFVAKLLQTGFDWTQNESYVWERKDAAWAANEAEWDDLWRRRIKNEYLRLMIGRELEARTNATAAAVLTNQTVHTTLPRDMTVEVLDGDASATAHREPVVEVATHVEAVTNGLVSNVVAELQETATNASSATPATNVVVVKPPEPIETVLLRRYQQAQIVVDDSDAEQLLQRYLTAFTQAYDPHSTYFTPSAMRDFEIEMNLALFGIGALLSAEDGAAKIVRLIPGGPADRDTRDKRLQPGDKIIAVAQDQGETVDVLHWPLHKIVSLIRGEKGTRVVLTVIPASDPSGTVTKTVDLVRDEVKLEDQAASGKVHSAVGSDGKSHKLGVVHLPTFYGSMGVRSPDEPGFRSAVYDVVKILNSFKTQQVEGVILDLRGNGGGALVEAIDMTGLFIRRGPTVQVKERFVTRPLDDEDPRIYYEGPLVVLVNRLSASASEIVAGALQDYGRALIVGDSKTHGKGTVQSVINLDHDDSLGQLKVTTASYIRITGASTQKQGVVPDIVVPSPWDFMDTGEEFLPNAIPFTLERSASFRPVADLNTVIPQLREQSEQRRRQNAQFQAYARLLERIAQMNDTHELTLKLDDRRQQAEAEQELTELQERLAADQDDGAEGDKDPDASDIVLSEGLSILADFITVQQPAVADRSAPTVFQLGPGAFVHEAGSKP
ncbi:MAG: carboxy terminal-processing peptidase [Lentisphaerae bacterium]|nr:carboxy terminal-processing peptidase [Lentisphaerota bacterium]